MLAHLSVPTALFGAALGSATLAALLYYLCRMEAAHGALRWWTAAFALSAVRYGFLFAGGGWDEPASSLGFSPLIVLAESALVGMVACLWAGAVVFFASPQRFALLTLFTAIALLWVSGIEWSSFPAVLRSTPVYLGAGAAVMALGIKFLRLRRGNPRVGYGLAGVSLVTWGFFVFSFPVRSQLNDLAAMTVLASPMLSMAVALSLIVLTQRVQRRMAYEASVRAAESEARFRYEEQRFKDFAEASSDWFWEMGPDLRFTYMSERVRKTIGIEPTSVLGKRRQDIADTTIEPDAWARHFADLDAGRAFRDFTYRIATPDGGHRFISISGRPIHGPGGRFMGYRGVGRDITREHEHEQRIAHNAAILQALIDNLPVGVSFVDGHLNAVSFNRQFLELLEFPTDRFAPGDPFEKFIRFNAERGEYGEGDVEEQVAARVALARDPKPHRFERVRPDGRTIEIRGIPLATGGFVTVYTDITERKEAAARLAASEARFRDFAESASDWLWEQDAELRFTFLSHGGLEPFGLKAADFIGKRRDETGLHGPSLEEWSAHHEDIAQRRPFRDFRFYRIDADGRRRWASISVWPIIDEQGRFKGYRGTGRDITAAVEAEERATLAQRRLAAAVENLTDGIAIFNADDRLVVCNEAYRRVMRPIDHMCRPGAAFEALVREDAGADRNSDAERAPEAFIKERVARHDHGASAYERQLADGTWVLVREQRLPDGGAALIITDISEVKRREAELAQQTALLRATLDNMAEGIAVFDQANCLVAWNKRYGEMLDLPSGLLNVGTSIRELMLVLARRGELGPGVAEPVAANLHSDPTRSATQAISRGRGPARYLELRRTPMPGGGFIELCSDQTERARAERALREAKETAELANRTKSEFLANMSHELRTPLNAVIGFSELIHRQTFGPLGSPRYAEYAQDILESGRHLLKVINDILDVSKMEAGKLDLDEREIKVDALVRSSARLITERAREANVRVVLALKPELPLLRADERRLKQVLLNLLSNAVKFTPAGGEVRVEAEPEAGGGFALSVHDTGIGIAPEDLPRVLKPFGQVDSNLARRYDGTGLGLSLSKALVELHGGSLTLASRPGEGTTVTVRLPAERVVSANPPRFVGVNSGD